MKRFLLISYCLLSACGRGVPDQARVVVAGDSVMAWNRIEGASVADGLRAQLGGPVGDVSLPLAKILGGSGALNIPAQLRGQTVEWVVVNGGANDLSGLCTEMDYPPVLDRLISEDGQRGAIPALVADLRQRGSKVVWADYYTAPKYAGTTCEIPYQIFETRLARMAASDSGTVFVDMDDVFSPADLSLFDTDRVHPSQTGSERIAKLVAREIAGVN